MATYRDRGGFSLADQRAAVNELCDLFDRNPGALRDLVQAAFEGNEEARLRLYRMDGAVSRLASELQHFKSVIWHRPYASMEDAETEGAWPFNQGRSYE